MPEVRSVTTAVLVGDKGQRYDEWCINGNVYIGSSMTREQAEWMVRNNNFCFADARRAVPNALDAEATK